MTDLKSQIIPDKVPQHIAIIMDGNGRWAKQKGMPRVLGHRSGVRSVREVTEAAGEIGVKYLTLYAFSTENWNRPPAEVTALMGLLVETIRGEIRDLNKNGVRLMAIGDLEALPPASYKALLEGIEETKTTTASHSCWRSTTPPSGNSCARPGSSPNKPPPARCARRTSMKKCSKAR